MKTFWAFLTDSKNKPSMTRLLSLVLVLGGVILAFMSMFYEISETLILGLVSFGIAGKLVQKHIEK
jgi:hypothetical protein